MRTAMNPVMFGLIDLYRRGFFPQLNTTFFFCESPYGKNEFMSKAGWLLSLVLSIALLSRTAPAAPSKIDIEGEITTLRRMDRPVLVRLFSGDAVVQEMMADSRGRFRFRKVDPGQYVIRVECDGYFGKDVKVQAAETDQHVSIALQPTADEMPVPPAFDPFRELDIPAPAKKEFNLGVRDEQTGQCPKAVPHFQKAIAIYPQYGEAFTELARCQLQKKDVAAAEESFKRALQFTPAVYPTVNLATLYVSQNRLDEAQTLIARALTRNPTEGELYAAMTRIYFAKGDTRNAEAAGLEAHSRGHRSPDVHLILANIYESQHKRSALLTQLTTYIDEDPRGAKSDEVRRRLADIQSRP
jgi:tetratricopeptide (TPR) repeat protein